MYRHGLGYFKLIKGIFQPTKTCALAALAAVSAASAQSTVEIYGRAHVGYDAMYSATGGMANPAQSSQVGGDPSGPAVAAGKAAFDIKNRQRVTDDSSRIGFRINEDLGGGLRAFSVIETGINIDTATNNGQSGAANSGSGFLGTREAHVGIGNNTAEVRLGRQNVFWGNGPIEDVGANRISGGVGSSYTAPSSGFVAAPAARLDNTVQLIAGPGAGMFAGSSVWFAHPVPAETAAPSSTATGNLLGEIKNRAQGFTLRAVQGPFAAQFDYGQNKNTNNGITNQLKAYSAVSGDGIAAPTLDSTITGQKLGLAYTYAPGSKVYFVNALFSTKFTDTYYNDVAPTSFVGAAASKNNYNAGYRKQSSNQVGIQHRIGALELHGQYVIQGNVKDWQGASVADTGSKAYAIGARYELSKRTALTGSFNVIDNDAKNNTNISGGGQSSTPTIGLGATLKVARVSIQHNF